MTDMDMEINAFASASALEEMDAIQANKTKPETKPVEVVEPVVI